MKKKNEICDVCKTTAPSLGNYTQNGNVYTLCHYCLTAIEPFSPGEADEFLRLKNTNAIEQEELKNIIDARIARSQGFGTWKKKKSQRKP